MDLSDTDDHPLTPATSPPIPAGQPVVNMLSRASKDKPCSVCLKNLTPAPSGLCGECCTHGKTVRAVATRRSARRRRNPRRAPQWCPISCASPPPAAAPPQKAPAWLPQNAVGASPGSTDISEQIAANMGLVFKVLKEFRRRDSQVRKFFAPHNPDAAELVQAGTEGLAEAIRYFNPSKGAFSTLAVRIIKRRMRVVIRWRAAQAKTFPGPMPKVYHSCKADARQWDECLQAAAGGSDDEALSPYEARDPADPRSAPEAERELEARQKWEERKSKLLGQLGGFLPQLPPMERRAVELHHAFSGNRHHSLLEVGKALGVGEARARQLVDDGIRQLRVLAGTERTEEPEE